MKTKTTLITLCAALISISSLFAQDSEGAQTNATSTYITDRTEAMQKVAGPMQNESNVTNAPLASKLAGAELINYQAVARDAGGNVMINANLTIDFEIRNGAGGAAAFNEIQNVSTDANGVFSAQIGSVSSLAGVNWLAIDPWLQVSLNGTNVGETQMGSVPTALHSNQSGSLLMFGSGVNNPDKMLILHSPAFSNYGIGYTDTEETVDFVGSGNKNLRINLDSGNLQTEGNITVNATTTAPELNTIYGNSVPIAYASVSAGGIISTGYGVTSVTNPAVGVYDVVLDLPTNPDNTVVSITPFTASIGVPEICGYNPTGANTFTVFVQTVAGAGRSTAFSFVVYGN